MLVIETPVTETRKELPVFRTAETILEACLVDIDEGRWICNLLFSRRPYGKSVGCAVGLVGINSGALGLENSLYQYPREAADSGRPWNNGAINALTLLAETSKTRLPNSLDPVVDTVTNHNDVQCRHPWMAREWFKRALVLAKERGL